MKKIIIVAIMLALVLTFVCSADGNTMNKQQYFRIHIRANSNSEIDQDIKYVIRLAVVEYLTPFLAQCTTKEQALEQAENQIQAIQAVANNVLNDYQYDYTSTVKICAEKFPTRRYDNLTLSGGIYDALIIELGQAQGDNWWCVVYPPLCFVGAEYNGTNSIVFRSKLIELINQWSQ